MKSNHGVAQAVVFIAIGAVAVIGYLWVKVFEPGRNKTVADKSAAAASVSAQEATQAKAQVVELAGALQAEKQAHADEVKAHRDTEGKAASYVEASTSALQSDPNLTPAAQAALQLNSLASTVLGGGTLPPDQMRTLVAGLIKQTAEAKKAADDAHLDALATHAKLETTAADSAAKDQHIDTLTTQLSAKSTDLAAHTALSAKLTAENKTWADGEQNWRGRMKAAGALLAVAVVGLIWYEVRRRGLTGTLQDAVALKEHIQTTAANLAPAVTADLQKAESAWWGTEAKAQAAFNTVKNQLRQ